MVRVQQQEEEEETHKDIWTEPVRTSLPVLESASDFQITGGSISSFGGDSTSFTARRDVHVVINHHHAPSPTPSGSSSSSHSINRPDTCADQGPEDTPSAHSRTHGLSSDVPAQFNLPVQRNCDVYRQHLATKGRGLPLWNPDPGHTLPIQYQRQGISMGDVGVVTASGGFAFLFNIFLPRKHPINPPIMPEGFKPLKFIQDFDTVPSQRDLKDNSYLASPSSIQAKRDRGAANLVFESGEYDGAILTIPVGAKSEDLACLGRLRKYVVANAVSWYRYVCLRRGMEILNGDLKVVTGCDKTSAWGMACLSSRSRSSAGSRSASSSSRGSGEEQRFYLEFGPSEGGGCLDRRGGRYEWAYSGEVAEVRAGPDACEVAQLRMARGDGELGVLEDDSEHYENQCLFLRTMNATLPEETWQGLMLEEEEEEEEEEDDDEATREEEEDDDDVDPRYARRSFGYRANADGRSGMFGQGSSTIRGGGRRKPSLVPSEDVNYSGPSSTTSLSRTNIAVDASDMTSDFRSRLTSLADHPSLTINRCLLQNSSPHTKMAVSVDQDWMSVLREDDVILPSSDELLERILENYRVCETEGVVFLETKDSNQIPVHPAVLEDEVRGNLTPAQLEDFESTFRYFDKDETHTLASTELTAALASLGVVYCNEHFDPIYGRLLAEYGAVTFESFIELMLKITEEQKAGKGDCADHVQELETTVEDTKESDRRHPDVFKGTSTAGVHRTRRSPKLKALLIGVDRPDSSGLSEENEVHHEMSKAHCDVEIMRRYLIDDLGYDVENIAVLVDNDQGDHMQPTRANIISQMRKFVEDAEAGDQFFFLYSGHTGEENSDEVQEEDGKDEFITTSDNGVIMDDELRTILVDPLPPDCSLFAVFDSSHTPSYPDIDHYRCNRVSLPWVSERKQGTPKNTPSRGTFSVFKGLEDEGSPTLQGKESSSGRVQRTIPSGHQLEPVADDGPPFTRPGPPRLALDADPISSNLFAKPPSRAGLDQENHPRNQDGKKPDIIFLSSSPSSKKDSSEDMIGNFIAQWLLDILAINLKYPLDKIVSQISHTVYESFVHPLATLAEPTSISTRKSDFFIRGM